MKDVLATNGVLKDASEGALNVCIRWYEVGVLEGVVQGMYLVIDTVDSYQQCRIVYKS